MCSIFGWIPADRYSDSDIVNSTARKVAEIMNFRGPDDKGWHVFGIDGSVGTEKRSIKNKCKLMLGQNRLSIIDLSSAGHQPMVTPDGRYTLVLNGEIYNYKELKIELENLGYRFTSKSDTQVLLYSYVEWGRDCLYRFIGMFAFAIYDLIKCELFCARDFFGIKPFFYQLGTNGFTFASELPAIFEFPGTARKLNPGKAYDYLMHGSVDNGEKTMLKDVFQLPPAHYCVIDIDKCAIREINRYWEIDLEKREDISFNNAAERLRELFLESVKLHLRSDVPLGIALSGGVDSSAVACAVRYLYPDMPINTFSYVAHDSAVLSEEKWIDIVNEYIGAVSYKVHINSGELFDDLDFLIKRQGEPFGGTSIYAQYHVFRLVRESGITVTLDGQGADELLAGYVYYASDRIESLLRKLKFSKAFKLWSNQSNWPDRNKNRTAFQVLGRFFPLFIKNTARYFITGDTYSPEWINIKYISDNNVLCTSLQYEYSYNHSDKLRQALAFASTVAGLSNLLRHGDRNSMTWSVESRVPFCNRDITEFVLSLPEEYLIDQAGQTKSVFREAMRGIVPDVILDRRDKIGFETPEKDWLPRLSSWVKPILLKSRNSKLLNHEIIMKEWKQVEDGIIPFSGEFWRQMNYLRWKELFAIEE